MTRTCVLVVCGAPLTSRAVDVARALVDAGWEVQPVATPSAEAWLDGAALFEVTGNQVRSSHRRPDQPRDRTLPTAVVVCPATFNTIGKLAAGISDTYALGVLSEALGAGVPMVAVPMVNNRLRGHPAWRANLERLAAASVMFVDVATGGPVPTAVISGTGDRVTAEFDPAWVVQALDARTA